MKHLALSCLQFECTNNTVEYEVLILCLQKALSLNIVMLKMVGDSEIVVHQVHNTIHCFSPRLKSYQQAVWRFNSNFQDFNIIFVPGMFNAAIDALENLASRMTPL